MEMRGLMALRIHGSLLPFLARTFDERTRSLYVSTKAGKRIADEAALE